MARVIAAVTNNLLQDQRMRRTCTSLHQHGFIVHLLGRTKRMDGRASLSAPYQQTLLPVIFHTGPLFYLEYNLRLFCLLIRQDFDLVCAVDLDTLPACILAAKLKQKKCLLDSHEYFTEVPELIKRPLIKRCWELLGHVFVPLADACYTVGPALSAELSNKYDKRFSVVRNVPKRQELTVSFIPEKFTILYQGMLNQGRGLEQLIDVVAAMEDVDLWIVGEGDLTADLQLQAKERCRYDNIIFKGFVFGDALRQLTLSCSIGVNLLCAESASYRFSLANKALDYIQAGKPSIQMNFPEYAALNKAYGVFLCIDELSHQQIHDAIRRLKADKDLYEQLAKQCTIAAADLCWEREEPRLLAIYQQVLST